MSTGEYSLSLKWSSCGNMLLTSRYSHNTQTWPKNYSQYCIELCKHEILEDWNLYAKFYLVCLEIYQAY